MSDVCLTDWRTAESQRLSAPTLTLFFQPGENDAAYALNCMEDIFKSAVNLAPTVLSFVF